MRTAIMVLSAGLTLLSAWSIFEGARPAEAGVYYPWCARYGGRLSPGVPICGFTSYQQCMVSVQGQGGYCEQNWPPSSARSPVRGQSRPL
ncbi:MAG: DUF3551 domain-containing protein [Xanthobacteraceae bacterium]